MQFDEIISKIGNGEKIKCTAWIGKDIYVEMENDRLNLKGNDKDYVNNFRITDEKCNDWFIVENEEAEKPVEPAIDYINFVCKTFDELKEQFVAKNKQYGLNENPLANFTLGSLIRYGDASLPKMFDTALDYENKHVAHLYAHGIDGNKVDESLKDIAVYSIIELFLYEEYKRTQMAQKVEQNIIS